MTPAGGASGAAAPPAPAGALVYVDVPDAFAPRAAWVLATLLVPLGLRAEITRDRQRSGDAVLAYAPRPVPGVPTIPRDTAAMELFERGHKLPDGAFERRVAGVSGTPRPGASAAAASVVAAFPAAPDAGFSAPCDLVASAFALLACWDERTCRERDRFGRLPYARSVFAGNPELSLAEPAVDAYGELLRAVVEPRLAALGAAPLAPRGWMWGGGFAVALTHDIDNLWRWTPRGFAAAGRRSARALRARDAAALRREAADVGDWLTHHLPHGTDPYWTFPQMLRGEDVRGVSSTFFVIARHTHRLDGDQPQTYARRIGGVLATLRGAGREVALHGNDADRTDAGALARDRADLAARAGATVEGVRYHYLRCLYHETLPLLEDAGLVYDSSLAFAEGEGFRCATSMPFHPYDLRAERPLRLVELPLAIMDTTLHGAQYRGLPAAEAERVSREVLDRVRRGGGGVALLWHNLRFDRRAAHGYDEVYWRLVDWALAEGALVAPAAELARRWTAAAGSAAP